METRPWGPGMGDGAGGEDLGIAEYHSLCVRVAPVGVRRWRDGVPLIA